MDEFRSNNFPEVSSFHLIFVINPLDLGAISIYYYTKDLFACQ